MKAEVTSEEGITIIRPVGKIDAASSPSLQEKVEELLDDGAQRVIFDMTDVPFVASAGLRVFAIVAKRLKTTGAAAVAGMSENVDEVFRLVGFDRLMPLCADVESAKQDIAATKD